jgi:uncharacterized protein (TIGR00255 family)
MSLRSMTGYGRGVAVGGGLSVTVEITTVNRKQLDVLIGLPRGLAVLESRVQEMVQQQISRGRVNVDLSVEWGKAARRKAVRVDESLAAAYVAALRGAAGRLRIEDRLDLTALMALPGVLQLEQPQERAEEVWRIGSKAVRQALRGLDGMRRREGQALQKDLQQRLDLLARFVQVIGKRAPQLVKQYRAKLKQRLADAGVALTQGDERLWREIVLFADRSDVTEELTRINSHLEQARRRLRAREATGRALDFLAQELFREINTIGSKAGDAAILEQVVEFKTELERIREQVQNIE